MRELTRDYLRQGPYTRVAAVLAVLVAGLSFIEDTQQCDVITGSKPRVEIRRRGFFDFMLGADGLKVFTGKVVSVTVTYVVTLAFFIVDRKSVIGVLTANCFAAVCRAERLRYFADGHQVTLEIDDCPIDVMVTGSVTLDPQEDHLEVARAICTHVGLDPETDISVEKLAGPVYKPHSN